MRWYCDGVPLGTGNCWDIYGSVGKNTTPKINRIHDPMETICQRYHCCNKININRSCFNDTQHLPLSLRTKRKRIEREFLEINGYPKRIVNQLKEECKLVNEQYHQNIKINTNNNTVTTRTHMLVLPYKGEKGEKLI